MRPGTPGITRRIWALPIVSTVILGIGLVVSLQFSTASLSSIRAVEREDYPFLDIAKSVSLDLRAIIDDLRYAIAEAEPRGIERTEGYAGEIRFRLTRLAAIPGQAARAERLMQEFDDYYAVAMDAARAMLKGEEVPDEPIDRMQAALRVLEADLAETNEAALAQFHARIAGSEESVRQALATNIVVALAVVLSLAGFTFFLVRNKQAKRELERHNAALTELNERLARMQGELVATARQAGMAEIATNVLHNVGNVLNSVNVSAGLMSGQLRASRLGGLSRALRMMEERAADLGDFLARDEKGRMLPGYLAKLDEALNAEHRTLAEELDQLVRRIDHIKDIVATQQSYAGTGSVVEPVQIADLVEDALRMNAGALTRHEVTVEKIFDDVPVLPLDKGRVLQILVNLIANAKQAMSAAAGQPHRLTLRVARAGKRLRVSVADNGEGIPPENLTRIFSHGFTTRKDGHGFGLHGSALAAKAMGGTLTVQSDGPGAGAVFALELPVECEETPEPERG